MDILIFFLIGWSITSILVNGSIFDSFRNYLIVKTPFLSNLMTCMQCSGFWVGFFIGVFAVNGFIWNPIVDYGLIVEEGLIESIFVVLAYGFLNSGISVFFNSLMVYFLTNNKT